MKLRLVALNTAPPSTCVQAGVLEGGVLLCIGLGILG